ncbi:hypothetical protein [Plantactinospora alkalitolerans]|uniref:hypothetical protein n=1 Tax=Plantactinospora alkalitolerans TaxID=2789879 RepID=UPI002B210DEE|nr:hypothetical protein [Plantactinospora alkalitolerans]
MAGMLAVTSNKSGSLVGVLISVTRCHQSRWTSRVSTPASTIAQTLISSWTAEPAASSNTP